MPDHTPGQYPALKPFRAGQTAASSAQYATSIEEPKTSPRSPHRASPQHHHLWRDFRALSASLVLTTWALEGRSYKKKGWFPSKFPTIRFNPSRFHDLRIPNKILSWDGRNIEPRSLVRSTDFAVRLYY
jgi:hypothetical protein